MVGRSTTTVADSVTVTDSVTTTVTITNVVAATVTVSALSATRSPPAACGPFPDSYQSLVCPPLRRRKQ